MFLLSVFVIAAIIALVAQTPVPDVVRERIEEFFGETTIPESHVVAIAFVIGVGAFHTPIKLVLRYFSTVVHELGHAFMAGALLAKPKSIHIHPSSSGLAIYELSPNWGRFRASLVSAAGYPAPGFAALAAVYAVQEGFGTVWTVFAASVLAVAIVLLIRNVWGFLWTTSIVVGSYFGITQLSSEWLSAGAVFIAGFLALSGIEFAWVQLRLVKHAPGSGVDAESISRYLGLGPRFVAWVHLFVSLATGGLAGIYAVQPYVDEMVSAFG